MLRLLLLIPLVAAPVLCRFTVRDVGFVDLGDPKYTLYAFASDDETPGVRTEMQRLAAIVFADTNVVAEVLDPDSGTEPAAFRFLRELGIQAFPTTVLVDPSGHAVEAPIEGQFSDAGGLALESIVSSPIRRRMIDGVLRRYCVVLLVEGEDPGESRRARNVVEASFSAIERVFDRMPKAVGDLPELIVIPRATRGAEKVLLFCLGVEMDTEAPCVAVMFGRGRRFGPILEGAAITDAAVLASLANAGRSCECELDRSWMRGPRVPLRWDDDVKQKAVDLLGFDPENPLVKSEISGILARGPKPAEAVDGSAEPTITDLLGYSEEVVVDDPVANLPRQEAESTDAWRAIVVTFGGILILSLGFAVFVFARAKRV